MTMQVKHNLTRAHTVNFDTDGQPKGVDKRCKACISHMAEEF